VDLSQTSKHLTDNLTHIIQNSLKLPHSLTESVRDLIFNNASWNNIAIYETEEDDADSLLLTTFPAHRDALLNYKQTRSLSSKYHFLAHNDNWTPMHNVTDDEVQHALTTVLFVFISNAINFASETPMHLPEPNPLMPSPLPHEPMTPFRTKHLLVSNLLFGTNNNTIQQTDLLMLNRNMQ
jgi:hypothetical protein